MAISIAIWCRNHLSKFEIVKLQQVYTEIDIITKFNTNKWSQILFLALSNEIAPLKTVILKDNPTSAKHSHLRSFE